MEFFGASVMLVYCPALSPDPREPAALVGMLVYILAFTHDDVKFGLSYDAKED